MGAPEPRARRLLAGRGPGNLITVADGGMAVALVERERLGRSGRRWRIEPFNELGELFDDGGVVVLLSHDSADSLRVWIC